MTRRLSYIDTTRAILITMVVLGHILNYANPGYDIIPYTLAQAFMNSFHMPAFFLLSGMLTDGEKWKKRSVGAYFVHKARTLLVPYLFFECLAILYKHFVLHSVSLAEGFRLMLTLRCNVGADWFLPAMFLACALYCLYIRFPNRIVWSVIGAVLCVSLRFVPDGYLWTLLFRGALGFVFMLAGNLLKKPFSEYKWWKIACAFLLTAVSAGICFKFSLDNSFLQRNARGSCLVFHKRRMRLVFCNGSGTSAAREVAGEDRRERADHHGNAPACAVYHPRKQQSALGTRYVLPDCRRGSGADPHDKPVLPSVGGEKKKGDLQCPKRNGKRNLTYCGCLLRWR